MDEPEGSKPNCDRDILLRLAQVEHGGGSHRRYRGLGRRPRGGGGGGRCGRSSGGLGGSRRRFPRTERRDGGSLGGADVAGGRRH